MNIFSKLRAVLAGKAEPEHLRRGKLGEQAARAYLERQGLKLSLIHICVITVTGTAGYGNDPSDTLGQYP